MEIFLLDDCEINMKIQIIDFKSSLDTALLMNWALQVAVNLYVKNTLKNSFTYAESDNGSEVRYPIDVKSDRFQSQLDVSCGSSYTEELWYNKIVYEWQYIYSERKRERERERERGERRL